MFEKGKSGNPTGRPKEDGNVKALARVHTAEAIETLATWMRSDNPKAAVQATMALLDRAWGRPVQAVTGEDGEGPVQIIIRSMTVDA